MGNSQHPHVVVGDIILLQPRPFVELQILDVFRHLRTDTIKKLAKIVIGFRVENEIQKKISPSCPLQSYPFNILGLGCIVSKHFCCFAKRKKNTQTFSKHSKPGETNNY